MPRAKLSLCAAVLYACWVSARRRFTSVSHAFTLDFETLSLASAAVLRVRCAQLFLPQPLELAAAAALDDERRIAALLTLMMQEQ